MNLSIENKSDQRVLLRFNSGLTRHLAPGETLESVEPVEIKGNARVERLQARHVIAIRHAAAAKGPSRSGDMSAAEAIEHIERTSVAELGDFLSPDENRATVLRAMEDKQRQ